MYSGAAQSRMAFMFWAWSFAAKTFSISDLFSSAVNVYSYVLARRNPRVLVDPHERASKDGAADVAFPAVLDLVAAEDNWDGYGVAQGFVVPGAALHHVALLEVGALGGEAGAGVVAGAAVGCRVEDDFRCGFAHSGLNFST